ncbi:hypothetical protein [Pseudomonas sp. RA_35y_Pfl2_P32]|uniref:hypothetical protein n=1 Tax=Pseudomonas sp. RA_35y_Pfl2_P32 TaxID=3088705 RepID=UPI0030D93DDE
MKIFQKKIANPMTIIAIFAALSETSAAVSLPFLDNDDREIYIWFLISFPFYLLFLFFITLNFNYKSLYAPSDFQKSKQFLKVIDDTTRSEKKSAPATSQTGQTDVTTASTRKVNAARATPRNSHGTVKTKPDYLLPSTQDPPACITLINHLCPQQQLPLSASVHCIRIVDARWIRKKKDTCQLLEKLEQARLSQRRLTMLLTCRESEPLINERLKKSDVKALNAQDSVCLFYNVSTQAMTVVV